MPGVELCGRESILDNIHTWYVVLRSITMRIYGRPVKPLSSPVDP